MLQQYPPLTAFNGRAQPLRMPVSEELPRTPQPVEKIGVELMAKGNRTWKAPKAVCLVPNLGRKQAPREFFNRLTPSRHFGE
jgi:hypothetical protein